MLKLIIDDEEIESREGLTIFEICQNIGKEIPHFCFHKKLKIAGNCRMCLVEVEKSPKLAASCAAIASPGMRIYTQSAKVKKAREDVMEMLLINHPLDCPICDQGGECDLQDQAFKYGRRISKFEDNKRAVTDKYWGPLIKTHMTRCIHCTRCVRFANDIAGIEEIGAVNRGEHMEIVTYGNKIVTSELSGNMIDLCPVGALTSRPFSFKARKWELKQVSSIDVSDATGSNIIIDVKEDEIMRILPRNNDEVNEEWISDKARFSYDGLKYQRLDSAFIRYDGALKQVELSKAIEFAAQKLKNFKADQIAAIAGDLNCCESMFALKSLFTNLGCEYIFNQFDYKLNTNNRQNYLFNAKINGIEKIDFTLLLGANPRKDAPIINAKIGARVRSKKMKIARLGAINELNYSIEYELGNNLLSLEYLAAEGEYSKEVKSWLENNSDIKSQLLKIEKLLLSSAYPAIIIGEAIYSRSDGFYWVELVNKLCKKYKLIKKDWNPVNILHRHASTVASYDIGYRSSGVDELIAKINSKDIKLVYLLASDRFSREDLRGAFVIYHGHHGDYGANAADIILPAAAYTEKDAIYINMEGRPQKAYAATIPLGKAQLDWQLILNIANYLKIDLGFNDLASLRKKMQEKLPFLEHMEQIIQHSLNIYSNESIQVGQNDIVENYILQEKEESYYYSNVICRASRVMARCISEIKYIGNL